MNARSRLTSNESWPNAPKDEVNADQADYDTRHLHRSCLSRIRRFEKRERSVNGWTIMRPHIWRSRKPQRLRLELDLTG